MINKLKREFKVKPVYIDNLIQLRCEGNTVPFIARYRKERTGGMNELLIREIFERYDYLTALDKRRLEIISTLKDKDKLSDSIVNALNQAETLSELEEIYAPFKSERKTKATIAKEYGLSGLAEYILKLGEKDETSLDAEALKYINENIIDTKMAIKHAIYIITDLVAHDVDIRKRIKAIYSDTAIIKSAKLDASRDTGAYESYCDFSQSIKTILPHRVMAIFRGEREGALSVSIIVDEISCISAAEYLFSKIDTYKLNKYTVSAISKAVKSYIIPAVENEVIKTLKENAEKRSIEVFANNLKSLIMTPPVKGKRILGLDPAFRTGCKYAAIDETGALLTYGVIYPVEPHNDYINSKSEILDVIRTFKINGIAIGNGTASRETENFISRVISDEGLNISYTIVSEAGASVYSASSIGAKEFPDLDVTIRGAISIARRVINPLAELVKIEPESIGVGMYQHDVNKKKLSTTLKYVVEDVVNNVGVDLNSASAPLLSYVSGLNKGVATNIVKHRENKGRFKNRAELLSISGIGEETYKQCVGFLKVYGGSEELDSMFIHPENYSIVRKLFDKFNIDSKNRGNFTSSLRSVNLSSLSEELDIDIYTLSDIITNLEKPDLDIRDTVPPVVFKKNIINVEDIKEGMILTGRVSNIVDFGAFVDLGLKNDGLIHISEISNSFIKSPDDILSVGDMVNVKVLSIDSKKGRISLSMKLRN